MTMLQQLFEYYHLEKMLLPLIDSGAPQTAWWVIDERNIAVFKTVDRAPPPLSDGIHWELKSSGYEGRLITAETYPKVRSLGDVMARLLTILLQNELQRKADQAERQIAQLEAQVHFKISQLLGTIFQREDITRVLLKEALDLIGATGAIVFTPISDGVFKIESVQGKTPYGENPPLQLPKGLLHQVGHSEEVLWLNNLNGNKAATAIEQKAHNVLALPIRLRDRYYGVIALFDRQGDFMSHHVRLLRVIANYGAIAYHNAEAIYSLLSSSDNTANIDVIFRSKESDWQEVVEHRETDWKDSVE